MSPQLPVEQQQHKQPAMIGNQHLDHGDGLSATMGLTNGGAAPAGVTERANSSCIGTTTTSNGGYYLQWSRIEKRVLLSSSEGGGGIRRTLYGRSSTSSAVGGRSSSMWLRRSTSHVLDSAQNGDQYKDILKGISGYAAPGEIVALMGPSGSGKTSLLNVLSGRSRFHGGSLHINQENISGTTNSKLMKRLKSQIAYVKQSDIFFEHLTVRDQFVYTALLRMDKKLSKVEKIKAVDAMIKQLRLTKVQYNTIMMCSGGEKKRINIGSEILTNPAVIILDEPTSGLDSTSAVSLIRLLSIFAKEYGKTVITSIHQPNSRVFYAFDKLLMLSEGCVVYFGTPHDSLQYLKTQNAPCPDGYNAADHWMDLLVIDNSNNSTDASNNNNASSRQQLEQAWDDAGIDEQIGMIMNDQTNNNNMKSSHHSRRNSNDDGGGGGNIVLAQIDTTTSKYNTSWTTQYFVLTNRALKNSRSAIFTTLNLTKSVAMGFIAGLLWFQMEYTEQNINDIRSYYFFTMTYWVFDAMFGALTAFPQERTVILKERSSGSYHLSAYFMAKTTADAPVRLNLPLIYMIISFWMAGISNSFITFVGTTGCTLLSVLAGEAIGLFVGAAIYDLQQAITTMTVFVLFLTLVGGFFVENIPPFLLWAQYLSPFKYAFDSSLQLVFNKPIPCDGSGALEELCTASSQNGQREEYFVSVDDLHTFMGIQGSVGFNVGMLLIICLVPRYCAYLALRSKKEGER